MESYRNLCGDSGVVTYDVGDEFVAVRFRSGDVYWYTYASTGAQHVDTMKMLARRGQGLRTYISSHPDVRANN